MRITVYDALGWLAAGISIDKIVDDFPKGMEIDIKTSEPTGSLDEIQS